MAGCRRSESLKNQYTVAKWQYLNLARMRLRVFPAKCYSDAAVCSNSWRVNDTMDDRPHRRQTPDARHSALAERMNRLVNRTSKTLSWTRSSSSCHATG